MGKRFDEAPFGIDHGPFLTGAYAPVFDEKVLEDLEVEGEIPADLNGVYLRNGPDQRFEPKAMHHPFDGDGMLFNAHFNNGKITDYVEIVPILMKFCRHLLEWNSMLSLG